MVSNVRGYFGLFGTISAQRPPFSSADELNTLLAPDAAPIGIFLIAGVVYRY